MPEPQVVNIHESPFTWLMLSCVSRRFDQERSEGKTDNLFVDFLGKDLVDLFYQFFLELKGPDRAKLAWRILKLLDDTQKSRFDGDGTERLVKVLHNRKDRCQDWLGGSDAKMLHEAADYITRLLWEVADAKGRAADAEAQKELAIAGAYRLQSLAPEESRKHLKADDYDLMLIGADKIQEFYPNDPSVTQAVLREKDETKNPDFIDPVWCVLETEDFWLIEGAGTSRYLFLKSKYASCELVEIGAEVDE